MSKTCSAFGHRETYARIKEPLTAILEQLITEQDVSCFYTGGMGEFDGIFSSAVRILKRTHPQVRLFLVLPYYTANINKERAFFESEYDGLVLPSALDGLHYKSAIKARNRWMIEQSDYIITCVYKSRGGAYDAMRYAAAKNKLYLNINPHGGNTVF